MSDTFDHEADAWDEQCFHEERYQDEDHPHAYSRQVRSPARLAQERKRITQLFGVQHARELKVIAETPRAKLYAANSKQAWIPVSQLEWTDSCSGPTIPRWLFGRINTRFLLTR